VIGLFAKNKPNCFLWHSINPIESLLWISATWLCGFYLVKFSGGKYCFHLFDSNMSFYKVLKRLKRDKNCLYQILLFCLQIVTLIFIRRWRTDKCISGSCCFPNLSGRTWCRFQVTTTDSMTSGRSSWQLTPTAQSQTSKICSIVRFRFLVLPFEIWVESAISVFDFDWYLK